MPFSNYHAEIYFSHQTLSIRVIGSSLILAKCPQKLPAKISAVPANYMRSPSGDQPAKASGVTQTDKALAVQQNRKTTQARKFSWKYCGFMPTFLRIKCILIATRTNIPLSPMGLIRYWVCANPARYDFPCFPSPTFEIYSRRNPRYPQIRNAADKVEPFLAFT